MLSQISAVNNSLFVTHWRCYSNTFSFINILEARSELKFHGIYRLGNRFSKFVWYDYLILIPDLLKGLCAEVSMECETTPRHALQLRLLGDMHSDMIGLKNL